jgi:hypothetical protein
MVLSRPTYRKLAVQAASGAYRCFWQKTGRWDRRGFFIEEKKNLSGTKPSGERGATF